MLNKKNNTINEVVFFKGIAILMVVFVHYAQIFSLPEVLSKIPMFFQMGCQIFFVLSAFTICISYDKKKPSYFEFIKKRIHKLHNGYWIMIIAFLIIRIIKSYEIGLVKAINPVGIIVNMLFLNGLVPILEINNKIVYGGWFVGTIVIFYLLFPLLYKIFNNKKIERVKKYFPFIIFLVTNLLLVAISLVFDYKIINNNFIYFSFFNQLSCFSIGFSLYQIYKENKFESIKIPLIKCIALLVISVILFYKNYNYSFAIIPFTFGLSFLYIYIFYTNIKVNDKSVLKKIVEKFGNYSWTIYLTQSIVIYFIFPYIKGLFINYFNEVTVYFLLLPIVYIIAYLSGKILNFFLKNINLKIYKEIGGRK